jgi:hypothetical protein
MTYDDKPKRKNLSPDELLQQAKLLHPENEAFVRGESKVLAENTEIYENLFLKTGMPFSSTGELVYKLRIILMNVIAGILLILLGTGFPYFMITSSPDLALPALSVIFIVAVCLPLTILGIHGIRRAWITAQFNENEFRTQIVNLTKYGQLILAQVEKQSRSDKYTMIKYRYVSPNTGEQKRETWYAKNPKNLSAIPKNVILLYLNDDCVIVL